MPHPYAQLRIAPPRHSRSIAAGFVAAIGLVLSPPGAAGDAPPYSSRGSHATLVYTIDIAGHTHKGNAKAGTYSDDTVHQRLDGTLHLAGTQGTVGRVENAQQLIDQTAPARQVMGPAIEEAVNTCGDDEACMTAAITKMSADMKRNHPGMLDEARKTKAQFSRHDIGGWALDPRKPRCSLHAVTQGSSRYRTIDAGEGYSDYVTGSKERHGEGREDCTTKGMLDLPEARANWNGDTRMLKLMLPGLSVDEQTRDSDGKTDTAKVTIPDVTLDDLHWSGKGPQSGQQTRQVTAGGIPATMTIRWTFTPDRA
ncbi:hypothetical protein [Frateuria sp.]|uniref:hypothetical protein n=1 Tax=Frateuria sp. TaxID=2211372 RepID=UPI0017AAA968|nr:hypothetical protein [Frateuria sp.]NUR22654.1 hypothetical protein [Frateuria sp.]